MGSLHRCNTRRRWVLSAMALVTSCELRSVGDPGPPLLRLATLAEDAAVIDDGWLAVAWRTPTGHYFPAQEPGFEDAFVDVFEAPPAAALVDERVARLDFFMAPLVDLEQIAAGEAPRGNIAESRAQLWWIHDANGAAALVPTIAADAVDDAASRAVPVLLLVDSGDPEARRCGDNVVADQRPSCLDCRYDAPPASNELACCATMRADFERCEAIVIDDPTNQRLPARVRLLP
jgi:hypothetical protein